MGGHVDTSFNLNGGSPKRASYSGSKKYGTSSQNYSVVFKIKYQTIPGEDLFVLGDIPELGSN